MPDPSLFIAPTEPLSLRSIGKTSIIPEHNGVDIMWAAGTGLWGIQRKEISDLIASRNDGRLAKELAQMESLEIAVLIVEGKTRWTNEGLLISKWTKLTKRQFQGMLWSCRMRGVWVERTDNLDDTIETVHSLVAWSKKDKHSGMRGRPRPVGNWGHVSSREWGIHLLSGLDGIGPTTAGAIFDHFSGVPMQWTVTEKELMSVPGIGKTRAGSLMRALTRVSDKTRAMEEI